MSEEEERKGGTEQKMRGTGLEEGVEREREKEKREGGREEEKEGGGGDGVTRHPPAVSPDPERT